MNKSLDKPTDNESQISYFQHIHPAWETVLILGISVCVLMAVIRGHKDFSMSRAQILFAAIIFAFPAVIGGKIFTCCSTLEYTGTTIF